MLKRNTAPTDHGKHLSNKPNLRVHHGFFQRDNRKIFLARNARYDVFLDVARTRFDDIRARIVGTERIANSNRNPRASHGENRFAM